MAILLLARTDSDFVVYLVAVLAFAFIAAVVNRVQKWWEELNKPTTRRPSPTGGERRPPMERPPAVRPRVMRPERPSRGSPPLPRPVIVERFPGDVPRRPVPPTPRPVAVPRPPVQDPQEESEDSPQGPGLRQLLAEQEGRAAATAAAAAAQAPAGTSLLVEPPVVGMKLSAEELRRAIVLNEILSLPLALRDV